MDYEALGKYTHLKQQRQALQLKLQALSRVPKDLGMGLANYAPPYPGIDDVPKHVATLEAVLPEIRAAVQQMAELWVEMERLRAEYNLPA